MAQAGRVRGTVRPAPGGRLAHAVRTRQGRAAALRRGRFLRLHIRQAAVRPAPPRQDALHDDRRPVVQDDSARNGAAPRRTCAERIQGHLRWRKAVGRSGIHQAGGVRRRPQGDGGRRERKYRRRGQTGAVRREGGSCLPPHEKGKRRPLLHRQPDREAGFRHVPSGRDDGIGLDARPDGRDDTAGEDVGWRRGACA